MFLRYSAILPKKLSDDNIFRVFFDSILDISVSAGILCFHQEKGFFMGTIKENWKLALDILRPSQKDLEHGLELHRN